MGPVRFFADTIRSRQEHKKYVAIQKVPSMNLTHCCCSTKVTLTANSNHFSMLLAYTVRLNVRAWNNFDECMHFYNIENRNYDSH